MMPPWAAVAGTNCRPSWSAARIAWRGSRRPCDGWKPRPRQKRRPSVNAEPRRRRSANGRGRNGAARPRPRWRTAPTTRPRATSQIRLHVEGRISAEDATRQEATAHEILQRLARQPGLILADEVGMGKTFVA